MKQLTSKEAIAFSKSNVWEDWDDEQIVRFQLFQEMLCVEFNRFHEAITKVLNRPVYTHEFAFVDELKKEYLGEKEPPTFEEILNLIPAEKRIVISLD